MNQFPNPLSKGVLTDIANGDEAAFCTLFRTYKQPVYNYSRHFTHTDFTAEEVTQEVFMKIWIHREKLPQLDNFDAWLMTVTRNCCFNQLKKAANELKLKTNLSFSEAIENVDQYIFEKENRHLLEKALEQLSPQQKKIFMLSRENGLKIHEIASQMQLSSNTVKVHLSLSLRKIRAYFEAHPASAIILLAGCYAAH
ncbi:MAG TPA: RNA polymerase sigma-70 factor [Ferruginibacter sp.]|nr:RNA polymerase sigma-70 factor [Ferruginibacter sp.]HMP19946.1 RNA polymerase sigma-70 factor [Ferruginibacter sp.]